LRLVIDGIEQPLQVTQYVATQRIVRDQIAVDRLLLFSGASSVRRSSNDGCILSRAPGDSLPVLARQPLRSRSPSPAGLLMASPCANVTRLNRAADIPPYR
jgi:hypothetical protein